MNEYKYTRPDRTLQDKLTKNEIKEYLRSAKGTVDEIKFIMSKWEGLK